MGKEEPEEQLQKPVFIRNFFGVAWLDLLRAWRSLSVEDLSVAERLPRTDSIPLVWGLSSLDHHDTELEAGIQTYQVTKNISPIS